MSSTTRKPLLPRWPLIVAILAPPIIIGAILLSTLFSSGLPSSAPTPEDMWVGASSYGPTSTAPPADVQVIHTALHDIGAQCLKANPDLDIIDSDVDLIIAFAIRFPVGRFPIDDETATASSLLLVTREAVKSCAPAEVGKLDGARHTP